MISETVTISPRYKCHADYISEDRRSVPGCVFQGVTRCPRVRRQLGLPVWPLHHEVALAVACASGRSGHRGRPGLWPPTRWVKRSGFASPQSLVGEPRCPRPRAAALVLGHPHLWRGCTLVLSLELRLGRGRASAQGGAFVPGACHRSASTSDPEEKACDRSGRPAQADL